ncbi:MAG: hypothetical protein ACE5KM_11985 [Planctomycetaceae bacterium]
MQQTTTVRSFVGTVLASALIGCGGGIESGSTITAKPGPDTIGGDVQPNDGSRSKDRPNGGGGTGTLAGVITYTGTAPAARLPDGFVEKDKYCTANKAQIKDESLIVGPKGGLANVLVYLERKPRGYTAPKVPDKPAVFDQKFCTFVPHILTLRVNQVLEIRNSDNTTHNMHPYPVANAGFNSSLPGPNGKDDSHRYAVREKIPIKVVCDVHPWMIAYHFPLDHPFVFVTKKDGKFTIAGLPAGTHTFKIWHEESGWLERGKTITIRPGETTSLNLSFGPERFTRFQGTRPKVVVFSRR